MFLKQFWKPLVWAMFVMVLSGIPGKVIEPYAIWNADKLVHVAIYFILSMFILGGIINNKEKVTASGKTKYIVLAVAIGYGGLIEVLQESVFINRSGNIPDFVANSLGAFLAVLIINKIYSNKIVKKLIS